MCIQVTVLDGPRSAVMRHELGEVLKAVLAHIYSHGIFVPIRPATSLPHTSRRPRTSKRFHLPSQFDVPTVRYGECLELHACLRYVGVHEGRDARLQCYKVDDIGVLGCFALADRWCLGDLKAGLLRYIRHTWSLTNAIARYVCT